MADVRQVSSNGSDKVRGLCLPKFALITTIIQEGQEPKTSLEIVDILRVRHVHTPFFL